MQIATPVACNNLLGSGWLSQSAWTVDSSELIGPTGLGGDGRSGGGHEG